MMKEDNEIEKLAIMVDADEDGIYCKFTASTRYQPCFEIIQRMGARVWCRKL
jgi:4-hydroxyphenylpyruvate dioxygenase